MSLREMLSDYWYAFQQELFPRLESELGPMGERYELFVAVLELVRVEALLPYFRGQVGRPEEDRAPQCERRHRISPYAREWPVVMSLPPWPSLPRASQIRRSAKLARLG